MDARQIIDIFGGHARLAEIVGEEESTTDQWVKTGVIPPRWQAKLFMLAKKHGLELSASDFFATPSPVAPAPAASPSPRESVVALGPIAPADALIFSAGSKQVAIRVEGGTQAMWATTNEIAELFDVDPSNVLKHIQNVFGDEELTEKATTAKFAVVRFEGAREVTREVTHYNLDVILSVGYRVNAKRATAFRQWATQTLRAYLDQGYVINEKALRESPEELDRLAAKIRSLRSEEKQVYAKVRECFKLSSSDFDPESHHVKTFYALLQDKFHHAVTGSTASKLIMDRADHTAENMGLQSMKGGRPTMADATAGKNYLKPEEIYRLHILSEQFLLFAESTALAGKNMTMESLHLQLDRLMAVNDYPVFEGYKDYIKDQAMRHAKLEYEQYKKRKKIEAMGLSYDEDSLAAGEYDSILH